MKTKLVYPKLVEVKEKTNLWSYKGRRLYYNQTNFNDEDETKYYQLVLLSLDPDDKIERNDLYYHIKYKTIHKASSFDTTQYDGMWCNKIIVTQDQLSTELIESLVDEYNDGGMLNFEIEMDWILGDEEDENQNLIPILQPKMVNGFITVVEDNVIIGKPLEDYINQKHSQDRCMGFADGYKARKSEESNLYTPQDLLEVMNLGMSLRQSQLNGSDSRSGEDVLYQWIENKKK